MKKKQLWVSILAGFLAFLMIFGLVAGAISSYAGAEKSSSEIEEEIEALKEEQKKNKEQIAALKGQLSANMDKMEQIVAQKNVIDQQIFLQNQQVQNLSKQITAYNSLIADKQAELDAASARWEELSRQYKERVRAMEENGSVSYWSVLFKANSFSDLLDRLNMIEEIAAADRRRMNELNEAAKTVEEAKISLEAEKTSLEVSKKELETVAQELNVSRAEADKLLKKLIATGKEFQDLIDAHEKKESETAGKIDELEYEYDEAKEREYQEWLASQLPPKDAGSANKVDGITWLLPITYDYFSSPFGYRIHPLYGDWRFHYGVDLSAPTGTPIIATRAGVVTTAAYEAGGAGYYVNINHMDGFVTRYMHMTHFIVSPGQKVQAGQVIGYCGSTGGSTGPHLHFGVYKDGVAVNPALYINIT